MAGCSLEDILFLQSKNHMRKHHSGKLSWFQKCAFLVKAFSSQGTSSAITSLYTLLASAPPNGTLSLYQGEGWRRDRYPSFCDFCSLHWMWRGGEEGWRRRGLSFYLLGKFRHHLLTFLVLLVILLLGFLYYIRVNP